MIFQDERTLTEFVARHVDTASEALIVRRIPTGKFNTSFFVEGGPVPLVLRIAPPDDRSRMLFYEHRMMRQEPALHALIRQQTNVPIPAIIAHDFNHRDLDRDNLLMERLPGVPISGTSGLSREGLADVLREVGR